VNWTKNKRRSKGRVKGGRCNDRMGTVDFASLTKGGNKETCEGLCCGKGKGSRLLRTNSALDGEYMSGNREGRGAKHQKKNVWYRQKSKRVPATLVTYLTGMWLWNSKGGVNVR